MGLRATKILHVPRKCDVWSLGITLYICSICSWVMNREHFVHVILASVRNASNLCSTYKSIFKHTSSLRLVGQIGAGLVESVMF